MSQKCYEVISHLKVRTDIRASPECTSHLSPEARGKRECEDLQLNGLGLETISISAPDYQGQTTLSLKSLEIPVSIIVERIEDLLHLERTQRGSRAF